ncbi:hypothetical protein BAUCODRAFT_61793 [Baudoinia panamericana UAMH 10762]|uniref:Rab-GAP TBC domain-containing protein n=1 Tax=Baudoinia panamericana (strain UAMH 10762) TaxID=717646 RepID=M2NMD3_BAUPA|nr:uncharacterized protein BAUCODRAFT_61793 [Baudoinia panamericana UAMH 10762]EMD00675.1 hypothetical protein BAUCODRAFT_61793 [Baudoinia panamericana UAMH 10762]
MEEGSLAVPKPHRFHARSSSLNAPIAVTVPFDDAPLEVDWQALDESEWQEKEDRDLPEGVEDESTAFLLARLEQENAKISAASAATQVSNAEAQRTNRMRSGSRPPSMGHLRKLVQDRNAPSIRYSLAISPNTQILEELPEPPPMTELEFWAALVQNYPSTASRLPTLTATKIRGGIPPPLRGVVWQSMAGARERLLEDAFERLQHEKSPYEGIINKDVGRSFPGVELFQDAEGEGQRMLGRVLKCYSLYDKDIGYCQGMGFLVGPLLMNMGEKEAFCVLVRLMDHYAMRPSFLPSLSGLHMRIYQFSKLLQQHHPQLSEHFASLGIEPAYLSQWFLSCFAVNCPLPMLFRIYDVIFAEGANETVMRVALALMRRNEQRMMESTEFEEIMQLLLGRGIWDSYGINADDLVDDFTSLGNIITHGRLTELEREFEKQDSEAVGQSAGFLPDVQAAAARFLGRLWAPAHAPGKSTSTLSPPSAENESTSSSLTARAGHFLRRSKSQHSISTLVDANGSDGSSTNSSGAASLASTTVTEPEVSSDTTGDSTAETMSMKSKAASTRTVSVSTGHGVPATPGLSKEEKDMHGQIEDLLTALSELQREHAQLAAMLQREREERGEDHRAVKQLIRRMRSADVKAERRKTLPPLPRTATSLQDEDVHSRARPSSVFLQPRQTEQRLSLDQLLEEVDKRMHTHARLSLSFETKAQLRSMLVRTREQLAQAEISSRDLSLRLEIAETSLAAYTSETEDLRAEAEELRVRVNEEFKARQKLELKIQELKQEAREVPSRRNSTTIDGLTSGLSRTGSLSGAPGLRELRLGRRDSTSSLTSLRAARAPTPALAIPAPGMWHQRSSSLATREVFATPEHEAVPEEALLLELVNAKTSEAQARAEVDEAKRMLTQSNKRHEQMLQALQAQIDAANKSADAARAEAEVAKMAAQHAREEFMAREKEGSLSVPTTPAAYDSDNKSLGGSSEMATPWETPLARKTAEGQAAGGWFWSRRTPSTPVAKINVTPPAE